MPNQIADQLNDDNVSDDVFSYFVMSRGQRSHTFLELKLNICVHFSSGRQGNVSSIEQILTKVDSVELKKKIKLNHLEIN